MNMPWDTKENMLLILNWRLGTAKRKCRQFYEEHRGTNLTTWYQTWLDMLAAAKKEEIEEYTKICLQ